MREFELQARKMEAELVSFVTSPPFLAVVDELFSLPEHLRHEFVEIVLLDEEMLAIRGVEVPGNLHIQRSFFADKRPTLFCVTSSFPPGFRWQKLTVTYDNKHVGIGVPVFALDEKGDLLPILQPPDRFFEFLDVG